MDGYICNFVTFSVRADIHIKRTLAVILLALYGFIITPVIVWHSHACGNVCEDARRQPPAGSGFGKAGHVCSICDHAYAPYIYIDEPGFHGPAASYPVVGDAPVSTFTSQPRPRCSSRGSPMAG